MERRSAAGTCMSLAALQQHDPYISRIVDVTGQVALYSFSPKANGWEKTDIEGTLFVYTRSASPQHGFTIMNRLNMHNLVEPVNKDLEFQLHEPFLLYRNASLSIYSIWFYDKNDCHRIAKLMAKVVQQEAGRAQQISHYRKSPNTLNGCNEHRPIDILEMLSKAKDEYERQNANCVKESLEILEPSSSASPMLDKTFQSGHKHLTVEELFGTSLPKEQPVSVYPNADLLEKMQPDSSSRGHNLLEPFSFEQSSVIHQPAGKSESPNVKSNTCHITRHECVTPVLVVPTSVMQPDAQSVSNYPLPLSPILNSATSSEGPSSQILPNPSPGNNNIMQVMPHTIKQMSPLINQPTTELNHVCQNRITGKTQYMPVLAAPVSSHILGPSLPSMDLLQKLKLTPQHDQVQQQSLSKAAIAPNFSSAVGKLATPESFKETHPKAATLNSLKIAPFQSVQQSKEPEVFKQPKSLPKAVPIAPAQFVTPVTTVAPSVLLSPSVFQHSAPKSTELDNKASSSPSPTAGATEIQTTLLPSTLSRSQLQETLIHLIKNDSSFLRTVHEVYMQVLTKNVDNIQL
ncbi:mRNA-decapping enzyme 1A isoform X2 [Rhinatrema bivittatum]|uniref:mRNA-decapping enzyme 1A isoform X2 n=1 Tax=Rhinatrema bivittatum TaxID=194408 RepID=UPI00112E274C|nr:mRNA-decapping enzyme 1A isoform X2 [Rhinatrema bivittatum]